MLWKYTVAADVTWAMGPLFIWSTIEPAVAVVTACLPHLAPLFKLATKKIKSYGTEHSATGGSSKPQRLGSGSGGKKKRFGPRQNFDFGMSTLGTQAQDDEIGLTNYVGAPSHGGKNPSIASDLDDYTRNQGISVKSTFVQTSTARSP